MRHGVGITKGVQMMAWLQRGQTELAEPREISTSRPGRGGLDVQIEVLSRACA